MTKKSSKAATVEAMEDLHASLARVLAEAVNEKELSIVTLPDGSQEVVRKRAPAILNVARQFLKDSGIEAQMVPESPMAKIKESIGALPFPGAEFDEVSLAIN